MRLGGFARYWNPRGSGAEGKSVLVFKTYRCGHFDRKKGGWITPRYRNGDQKVVASGVFSALDPQFIDLLPLSYTKWEFDRIVWQVGTEHCVQLKYLPTLDEYLHEAPEQFTMNETWSDVNKGLPLVNEHVMGERHSEYAAKWDMNFKFFKFVENAKDRGLGTLMSDESTVMRVVGAKSEDQESVREALKYCDENGQLVRLSKKEEARKYDELKRQSERGNVPEGQGCSSHQGSRIIGDKEHRVMVISDNTEFTEKVAEEFNLMHNGLDAFHFLDRFSEGKKSLDSNHLRMADNVHQVILDAIRNGCWVTQKGEQKTTKENTERKEVLKELKEVYDKVLTEYIEMHGLESESESADCGKRKGKERMTTADTDFTQNVGNTEVNDTPSRRRKWQNVLSGAFFDEETKA
eukprot:Nk52_evm8s1444 gene=Nk52_evmTU8s1444